MAHTYTGRRVCRQTTRLLGLRTNPPPRMGTVNRAFVYRWGCCYRAWDIPYQGGGYGGTLRLYSLTFEPFIPPFVPYSATYANPPPPPSTTPEMWMGQPKATLGSVPCACVLVFPLHINRLKKRIVVVFMTRTRFFFVFWLVIIIHSFLSSYSPFFFLQTLPKIRRRRLRQRQRCGWGG